MSLLSDEDILIAVFLPGTFSIHMAELGRPYPSECVLFMQQKEGREVERFIIKLNLEKNLFRN